MKCIPCRVTFEGRRYHVAANGAVTLVSGPGITEGTYHAVSPEPEELARLVRREASRQRRNRNARERHSVLRSLGLMKTPYGWE